MHTAMTRVQDSWNELLAESNMQQQVWAIMRQTVEEYRQDAEDRAAIAHRLSTYRQGLDASTANRASSKPCSASRPSSSTPSSCATSSASSPSASAGTWA
ncbi:hypothetical protein STENM223S_10405 [Streptomyces tendae]